MTIHIGAERGRIAATVLLPGDPYRARWAAQNFLDEVELVNEVRGMLAYTGRWSDHRVTIHGTGMGMPSLSIYANELIRDHDARTLIRIGSCGAMQPHVALRDVILAMTATSISTPSQTILRELNYAPCADFGLLHAAWQAAQGRRYGLHVGGVYSSDVFYDERLDLGEILARHGVLAVEMETAELYTLAARHGRRALAILTVSDHLVTGDKLSAAERESSFGDMVELALSTAFA
jgi:purine-nucleoside phosphorylase